MGFSEWRTGWNRGIINVLDGNTKIRNAMRHCITV